MLTWSDQGILLSKRTHGETGGIISLLTENHGRHHGYIYGAHSTRHKGLLDIGAVVNVNWSAKTNDQLGHFEIEDGENMALDFIDDPLKLAALMSVSSMIEMALPEREEHVGLFWGTHALLENMSHDHIWGAAIIMWEISFMKELGFALDFSRCAGGGVAKDLIYMSPKSGCTVSREKGDGYKDKLLPLPNFLVDRSALSDITLSDVLIGLNMTGYFLEHWVFAQHSKGIPETRLRFARLLAQSLDQDKGK